MNDEVDFGTETFSLTSESLAKAMDAYNRRLQQRLIFSFSSIARKPCNG